MVQGLGSGWSLSQGGWKNKAGGGERGTRGTVGVQGCAEGAAILHQQPAPGHSRSVFPDEARASGREVGAELSRVFLTDSQFCD